ncbi:MAG: NUDIX domain-containing protein [Alphaproteobacteria bacterium]|nr:NUDIX domain-containing protein [Alphaproteobacteria bacterium]
MSKTKLSVCGVMMYQGKFLIVKRSENDDFLPNCWEFPGGSVEPTETITDALIRELNEEIGVDVSNTPMELVGISEEFMNSAQTERYLQLNYEIPLQSMPKITLSAEHVAYDWADDQDPRLDDFLKDITQQITKSS